MTPSTSHNLCLLILLRVISAVQYFNMQWRGNKLWGLKSKSGSERPKYAVFFPSFFIFNWRAALRFMDELGLDIHSRYDILLASLQFLGITWRTWLFNFFGKVLDSARKRNKDRAFSLHKMRHHVWSERMLSNLVYQTL